MALKIQVVVFWVMTPHNDVVGYHHFRGQCFFHSYPEDEGSLTF